MESLDGRVAFITGAASGIGLALARRFAREGLGLALADIEAAELAAAADNLRSTGVRTSSHLCDVAEFASVETAVADAASAHGRLDILCNNAGVGLEGPVESWTTEGWSWVLGVNLMGVVNGVRAALPVIEAGGQGGHIVNTASIGGVTAAAHHGQYAASKFAVVGLSQSLRDELAPRGVGVSVLCPGFVTSRIATAARNAPAPLTVRQEALMNGGLQGPAAELFALIARRTRDGLDPAVVAEMTLAAIRENAFYVFTESEFFGEVERRLRAVRKGMEATLAWEASADRHESAHA